MQPGMTAYLTDVTDDRHRHQYQLNATILVTNSYLDILGQDF